VFALLVLDLLLSLLILAVFLIYFRALQPQEPPCRGEQRERQLLAGAQVGSSEPEGRAATVAGVLQADQVVAGANHGGEALSICCSILTLSILLLQSACLLQIAFDSVRAFARRQLPPSTPATLPLFVCVSSLPPLD